jgi:hypothetical protein
MANQFQSIQYGLAELKNFYQGPIVSQLNDELPVLRAIDRVKEGWSGFQVVRPLKVVRNQGIGATSDGGNLPAIGRQTTVQALIPAKFNYLRFGITGPMIKSSQSDVGSFVRSAAYELEEGYNDLKSDLNRQFSWNGNGTLAQASGNATSTTSFVISGRESVEPALKFLDVGTVFDIVSAATSTVSNSGIQVVAISSGSPSSATATLTLSAPVTCLSGDLIIRSGSLNNEIQGLLTSLDGGTTTIYNVNRAQYLSYQGNVRNLGNAQLSLDQMQAIYNDTMRRGGSKIDAIYSDFDTLRMYQKLLTADKRYTNTVEGDGGFAKKDQFYLEFNGTPHVPDKDCPQRLFVLSADSYKNYVLCELEFADETGSMYIAQTSADQLEVRVRYFANLFPEKPAANGVLTTYVSP